MPKGPTVSFDAVGKSYGATEAVAGVSLLVAALGISRLVSPAFEAWSDGKELAFGALLVLSLAASYLLARTLAARRPPARQHAP